MRMKKFAVLFSLISLVLNVSASSQWMWHGAFPWVYSHDESSWWYMKAGTDDLLSTVARYMAIIVRNRSKHFRDKSNDPIACIMAVRIIDALKMVYIAESYGQRVKARSGVTIFPL